MKQLLLLLPAIILLLAVYPIGINTNVSSINLTALEIDAVGPEMQLNDISEGFLRVNPRRHVPIFHSIVISFAYVPYIWVRGGGLPPYNLNILSHKIPSIAEELIIISRAMNILAALGIVILSFYIFLRFCNSKWGAAFVALSVILNANLMFQSSVTYFENYSIFWVFLSLYCFGMLWTYDKKSVFWLSGFLMFAAFAVSTHERMSGYFVLSAPAAFFRVWQIKRSDHNIRYILWGFCIAIFFGLLSFSLANNIFGAGITPIKEYVQYKASAVASSDRFSSFGELILNQVRCHGHAVIIIICTFAGITPLFSFLGIWKIWKSRNYIPLVLLFFPLGYELVSVGLPGWTAGRYILGQMIFISLFAGFGAVWLMDWGNAIKPTSNRRLIQIALLIFALLAQGSILAAVKVLDYYYNPRRVVEIIAKNNEGGKIGVQSFGHGATNFSEQDFKSPIASKDLIDRIQADNYELPVKVNNVDSLNGIIEESNFYDKVVEKMRNKKFSPDLIDLANKTKDVRGKLFSTLLFGDQKNIKRLNRMVLEEIYPLETPNGLTPFSNDWARSHNVEVIIIPNGMKKCNNVDVLVTKFGEQGCRCENIRKEVFRKPPDWILRLVSRERAQLYLYETPSAINIQYCN
ncbi:MAG: phospholipid carrier-dependent glycosyltransferase [Proteobacteria bacterium]|nr:phospholipid carrier-dependent glycosyltransferase [Pseudomonadota bacterium]